MCGGFVAAYTSGESPSKAERALSHAAYNGGRLLIYAALGASAGVLGSALDLAGHAAGLADVAGIVAGLLLLFWGALGLVPRAALIRLRPRPKRAFTSWVSGLFAGFVNKPPLVRAGLLGLSTTLLPCGWLYAFVALAAASGGAAAGAWLMTAFWVGSLPMMFGLGWSLQGLAARLHTRLPRLRSALVLGVGVVTLLLRFQSSSFAASQPPSLPDAPGIAPNPDCPFHRRGVPEEGRRFGVPEEGPGEANAARATAAGPG
jgi:sulfite exporter TauE/SafE